jgi:hypothetical protein
MEKVYKVNKFSILVRITIICLHRINWLVFVMKTECVYYEVATENFKYCLN